MIHETTLAIIIAFAISVLLYPIIIPFLYKLKLGQQARDNGPRSRLKKQEASTMGGLTILSSTVITSVSYIPNYPRIIPVLLVMVGFGIIGFLDDHIRIVMKRSEGPKLMQKSVGQFTITSISVWYLLNSGEVRTGTLIPFMGGFDGGNFLSLGISFVPALFFIILGTGNGVNFTDGLNGPCTNVTVLVATFLTIMAIGGDTDISSITEAVVGSLLGLLLFNVHPAKMFMGGTGSLALGGFVAASCYMMHMPLFISVIGLIYLAGILSVIIWVTYFKRTGGKRTFKVVPVHHRFELCGWSETRVVAVFTIMTVVLYMVAYLES